MTHQRAPSEQAPLPLRVAEVSPSLGGSPTTVRGAGQHLFSLFRAELLAYAAARASSRQQEVTHA